MKSLLKSLGILCLLLTLFSQTNAQTPTVADSVKKDSIPPIWDLGGKGSITLAQSSQQNWVKGGEPNMSFVGNVELFSKYNKNRHSWETLGKFDYGRQKQGKQKNFRTSSDLIDINTKYGYKGKKNVYYSALTSFKSQFAEGREYADDETYVTNSKFMAPAYLQFALGFDYKPSKKVSVFLSPLTTKSTFVTDTVLVDQTLYGLDSNKMVRHELGAFIKASHKINIFKNVEMENGLELFSNYIDNPQNIDVQWDFKLTMSVNKYIKAIFATTLIYDHDTKIPVYTDETITSYTKLVQFKQLLSAGLMYTF